MSIVLYAVVPADQKSSKYVHMLTVSYRKRDCIKYLDRLLMMDNCDHFRAWCELRELDPLDDAAWEAYKKAVGVSSGEYSVVRLRYTPKALATILRLYNGCVPLGGGYETQEEYEMFIGSLPEDARKELLADVERLKKERGGAK